MNYEKCSSSRLAGKRFNAKLATAGLLLHRGGRMATVVALIVIAAGQAMADGSFQGLGDLPGGAYMSSAREISADGSTVVGSSVSDTGAQAYMWRTDVGMVGLGNLPGRTGDGRASHLTPDGLMIVGSTASGSSDCGRLNFNEAFLWTEETGMVGLGDIPGGCSGSNGIRISADGKKVLCSSIGDRYEPALWTTQTGMVGMEINPNGGDYSAIAATPDFTVFAGSWYYGQQEMWRWSAADGWETIGDLPGGSVDAYAVDITADGNTIVGRGNSNNGYEASRWTRSGGWEALGDLDGGAFNSFALSILPDGALVVGYGTSAVGQEAIMWDRAGRMRRVADVLACNDVTVPDGWILQAANAITINGNEIAICGTGMNPDGQTEAWLARYSVCIEAPCFQRLCDLEGGEFSSSASEVSGDGSTVVGESQSDDGPEAFVWQPLTGMVGLGDLPGNGFFSSAQRVSRDGSVVCGRSFSGKSDHPSYPIEGFRWTAKTGMVGLGDLPGDYFFSDADGMSADGDLIVGQSDRGGGWGDCFYAWTPSNGMQPIGDLPTGLDNSGGNGVSANGTWVVGFGTTSRSGNDWNEAFRWSADSGFTALGFLADGYHSTATDVTDDGSIVVGHSRLQSGGFEGFRWTSSEGMLGLGDLPGGAHESYALAITPDGALIVGYGTSDLGQEAVIWNKRSEASLVADVLASEGISIPSDWVLNTASSIAISDRTVTLCGTGTNATGKKEAWIARYPLAPERLRGDMNCDGSVDFNDIDPFVAALISRDDYESQYPDCNWFNGDINQDDSVDFNDIDGFVECLINSGCP